MYIWHDYTYVFIYIIGYYLCSMLLADSVLTMLCIYVDIMSLYIDLYHCLHAIISLYPLLEVTFTKLLPKSAIKWANTLTYEVLKYHLEVTF